MTWGAVAGAVVGVAGNAIMGHQNANTGNNAAAQAQFRPTNISDMLGSVVGVNPGGQLQYQANPGALANSLGGLYGNLGLGLGGSIDPNALTSASNTATGANQAVGGSLLGQSGLAQQLSQFLATQVPGAGGNFTNAGNSALASLGNFDPQQYAQSAYNKLASVQNAYNTQDTGNLLNFEQSSGRGAITQNGQLGDLGGLALAQGLTNNNLASQSQQLALQQQSLLGNQANSLAQTGAGQAQSSLNNYLNTLTQGANVANLGANQYTGGANTQSQLLQSLLGGSLNANSGVLNINNAIQSLLNSSVNASQGQAVAGNNAAQYGFLSGMQNANNTGNLIGGINTGLTNSGAYSAFGNWLSGLGKGSSQPSATSQDPEGG